METRVAVLDGILKTDLKPSENLCLLRSKVGKGASEHAEESSSILFRKARMRGGPEEKEERKKGAYQRRSERSILIGRLSETGVAD